MTASLRANSPALLDLAPSSPRSERDERQDNGFGDVLASKVRDPAARPRTECSEETDRCDRPDDAAVAEVPEAQVKDRTSRGDGSTNPPDTDPAVDTASTAGTDSAPIGAPGTTDPNQPLLMPGALSQALAANAPHPASGVPGTQEVSQGPASSIVDLSGVPGGNTATEALIGSTAPIGAQDATSSAALLVEALGGGDALGVTPEDGQITGVLRPDANAAASTYVEGRQVQGIDADGNPTAPANDAAAQLNSDDTAVNSTSVTGAEGNPTGSDSSASQAHNSPGQSVTSQGAASGDRSAPPPIASSASAGAPIAFSPAQASPAAQVAQRISEEVDRINATVTTRVQRLTMRLSPEGLGDVTLTLRSTDQGLSVSVRSDSAIDGAEIRKLVETLTSKPVAVSSSTTGFDSAQGRPGDTPQQSANGNAAGHGSNEGGASRNETPNSRDQARTPGPSQPSTTHRNAMDGDTTVPLPSNGADPTSRGARRLDVRM